jgi:hypothetical protein
MKILFLIDPTTGSDRRKELELRPNAMSWPSRHGNLLRE